MLHRRHIPSSRGVRASKHTPAFLSTNINLRNRTFTMLVTTLDKQLNLTTFAYLLSQLFFTISRFCQDCKKGSPMKHAIIMSSILYIVDRSYFTLSQHRQRPKHARKLHQIARRIRWGPAKFRTKTT